MGKYTRYPLGATVVVGTTVVFCFYTIIMVTYLIVTFGKSFTEGCADPEGDKSFLQKLFRAMEDVAKESKDDEDPKWIKWFHLLQINEDNCEKILQPVLGTLIAWDVIVGVLLLSTTVMFVGIMKQRPSLLVPFLTWLGIMIVFVFGVVIAIATKLTTQEASLIIACSMLFLIVPSYYWMVILKHKREAIKTADDAATRLILTTRNQKDPEMFTLGSKTDLN